MRNSRGELQGLNPQTELLVGEATAWTVIYKLPGGFSQIHNLKAATLDNRVLIAGGMGDGRNRNGIWRWEEEQEQWSQIGSLSSEFLSLAVSRVDLDDVAQYCSKQNETTALKKN